MLSILTAKDIKPEFDAVDRDPGFISLVAAIVRSMRTGTAPARLIRARYRSAQIQLSKIARRPALKPVSLGWR